jgi:hypothetical protein
VGSPGQIIRRGTRLTPAGSPYGRSTRPDGRVVEPACCLSAIRIETSDHGGQRTSVKFLKLAPRDGLLRGLRPLRPSGRPGGRSSPLRGAVEPACFMSAVRISADASGNAVGLIRNFFKIGSPGRIIRAARSPLRGRPGGRSPPLRGVVEPAYLSVGGSN